MNVLRRFYADYGETLGGLAVRAFDEVERAPAQGRLAQRASSTPSWPAPRPEQVVRQLLASRERLAEAADGILDDGRAARSSGERGAAGASPTCRSSTRRGRCSAASHDRYGHVIVDEAQDLTPMQLRMVARRCCGSFTILGDVAQATGPVPYARWDELLPHLPGGGRAEIEELVHAYRVPREIMALALPLLEHIAPDVEPPVAYRAGAEPPRIVARRPSARPSRTRRRRGSPGRRGCSR